MASMLRIVRFVVLTTLVFLTLGLVVAAGGPETGPIEKVLLAGAAVGVVALSVPVQRIDAPRPSS
jgi:hypothetical protein